MKRAHVSPLLLILTATISLSSGIGITLVAEDLAGIDTLSLNPEDLKLPDDLLKRTWEELIEWIAEHPETADALTERLMEMFKNGEFDINDLMDMLSKYPNATDALLQCLKEMLESGEYSMDDLQKLLQEHPELVAVAGDAIQQYINGLKEKEEGEETSYNYDSGLMNIDDGSYDPEAYESDVFTVDSTYRGAVYIRNASYGDYEYGKNCFAEAPSFDASTYMASPLIYAGLSFENSYGESKYTLTFHFNEDSVHYGMLTGDYVAPGYTSGKGEFTRFSKSTESRIRRVEDREYSVDCYPSSDPEKVALPSYLSDDEKRYYAYCRSSYTSVPEEMEKGIEGFIEENSIPSNATPTQIERLFKTKFTYEAQTGFASYDKSDLVLSFLASPLKAGTCTNFASAMTLICRSLGYPSRMVSGYLISAKSGENAVKKNNAHAWVEVYSSGHGWVRYDPTPASVAKEESPKSGGSDGEVGDKAYDPNNTKSLFSVSTNYYGSLYLRSASFADYDPSASKFSLDDELAADESSLLYSSSSIESSSYSSGYLIQMHMGGYRDTGMIFASYPSSEYAPESLEEYEYSPNTSLRPVSDGRFFRENINEYTYRFFPEYYGSYPQYDDYSYRSSYLDSYKTLPDEYWDELASFCSTNNIYSLDQLVSFFENSCELDNEQTGYDGDAILNFLNLTRKGNSSVFAGAYTLLARYLGNAARFVSGYKVTGSGDLYSPIYVKQTDAYYWVEVYQRGFGWKRVDPCSGMKSRPNEKIKVTLKSVSSPILYDGTDHAPNYLENIEILKNTGYQNSGALFDGDRITYAEFPPSMHSVECNKFATMKFRNVVISDKFGRDVTSKYDITYDFKTSFEIVAREITITTEDVSLYTDGDSFDVTESDISRYNASLNSSESSGTIVFENALAEGDTIQLNYDPSIFKSYKVGESFSNKATATIKNASGEDVTNNYSITYVYGTVTIETQSAEKNDV